MQEALLRTEGFLGVKNKAVLAATAREARQKIKTDTLEDRCSQLVEDHRVRIISDNKTRSFLQEVNSIRPFFAFRVNRSADRSPRFSYAFQMINYDPVARSAYSETGLD